MGIKINFDAAGNPVKPTFVLTTHSGNRLGLLTGVSSENINNPLMDCPEVTFSVTKSMTSKIWDYILDFKLIYCQEWDTWFEIKVELDDADATIKNVTGSGLCQSELSQILVHGLEFNTEDDIARDDYERSIIYNFQNPNASVLHSIFQKAPHYKLVHVDASIASMQKTLSFDGVSIQDALNEIEQECHCLVVYNNSTNPETNLPAREVSIYDLETICNDCGHRGEYTDFCPECGSTNIKYGYGNDTRIFVSKDNLTDEVKYYVDVDQVKNCFKLVAGDDVMTSAIQACNPNGTDYIWYISDATKEDMPPELVEKINSYDILYDYYSKEHVTVIDEDILNEYNALVEKYKPYNKDLVKIEDANIVGYSALMNIIYDVIDFNAFLQTSLMPIDDTVNDTTAEKQAALLTNESLSPIALSSVSEYSEEIINQMILAVARIIIDNRYDVKIKTSQLFINENEDDDRKHQWVGSFTVTNYADSDLTADTGNIIIFINKDYDTYIRQKVEKVLDDTDVEDYSISNLLKLEKTLDEFKLSIKPYNISVLLNLKDACDTCLDTLQAESIGNQTLWKDTDGVDMYDKYYLNYYNKLEALVDEIELKTREQEIINNLQNFITGERNKIQEALNFENYLGKDLWLIFCSYRREDIYKNENYISDNLSNAEIFNNAREFYEVARKEIFKSATLQHRISSTLKNLLAIPEFEPLRDSFELGNWIRIEVDGEIYRLRLIEYDVDFDNIEELNVEFSDCTKTSDGVTDVNSLLSKTASMATSYGGVKRQATKGNSSYATITNWFTNGLDATLTKIMDSSDTQDVVIDKHGILIRDYDDVTESYWPEQMKFINKTLAITTDNWKTLVTAIGSFIYQDPITREFVDAYGVNAQTVIGNLILGSQLGIYNDNASMCFNENGLWIYNDTNSFRVNPNSDILLSLSKNDEKMLWVDENGMLHISGDGAGLDITANSSVTGLQSEFKVTSDEIKSSIEDTKNGLSSEISETANNIRLELQNTASGLDSKIDVTASSIRQEVADYKKGLESSITQTATEIRSEISDVQQGLESSITQTSTEIQAKISDLDSGLNSKIDQTASAIRQEVTDGDAKLQSSITETAAAIRSEVKDVYDGLSTNITETASAIRAEAQSQYDGLNASLEIQAGQIESLVSADIGFESRITQNADKINFVVSGDNESGFAMTDDAINMTAQYINAKGLITFSGLDGEAQKKIESFAVKSVPLYTLSSSNTAAPDKTQNIWYSSVDWNYVKNTTNYVWQLIETTYGNGTTYRTDPVCISDGKEIVSIKPQYYLHTSNTDAPADDAAWSDICPSYMSGKYIWTRNYITYSDGTKKTTTPIYDSGLTNTHQELDNVATITTDLHSVYYSSSAPPEPHVVGDVWYQTAGSEVIGIYVWNSSGYWSQKQNGQATIANGSIVADLVAAGAITAPKIATDALKSTNYVESTDTYSMSGTFFNLADGSIQSPNFAITSEGNAYIKGAVIATEGAIGNLRIWGEYLGNAISQQSAGSMGMSADDDGWAFWANGGVFSVNGSGDVNTGALNTVGDFIVYSKYNSSKALFSVVSTSSSYSSASFGCDIGQSSGYNAYLENTTCLSLTVNSGGSTFKSSVNIKSTLNVTGSTTLSSLSASTTTLSDTTVNGKLVINGDSSHILTVNSSAEVSAHVYVGQNLTVYGTLYTASGTVSTSDERDKNIIGVLDERYKQLFMSLEPIVFTWKDERLNNKYHFGLGAQSTEKKAIECGISVDEIGAIEHSYWDKPDSRNGRYDVYGILYNEIHMLTIPVVQDHERKLLSFDTRFISIEDQLETVKTQLAEAQETIEILQQTIKQLTAA